MTPPAFRRCIWVTYPGLLIGRAVMVRQLKSIDRAARELKIAGAAPRAVLAEVQAKIAALLGIDD